MKAYFAILVLTLAAVAPVHATRYPPPKLQVVSSPDGSAMLRVTPGELPRSKSGPRATVLKYDAATSSYSKVADFPLRNSVAPEVVVITDGGEFVITFDDWGASGSGDAAVVVYRGTGEFVRAWRLTEIFSAEELKELKDEFFTIRWHEKIVQHAHDSAVIFVWRESPNSRKSHPIWRYVAFDVAKLTFWKSQ